MGKCCGGKNGCSKLKVHVRSTTGIARIAANEFVGQTLCSVLGPRRPARSPTSEASHLSQEVSCWDVGLSYLFGKGRIDGAIHILQAALPRGFCNRL